MAIRKYYIGSTGPYFYDDNELTADELKTQRALRTDGQIEVESAPASPFEVVRQEDLEGVLSTELFDNPGEILVGAGEDSVGVLDAPDEDDLVLTSDLSRPLKMLWKAIVGLLPGGGTPGQVLTKQSGASFDVDWEDPTGGGGGIPPEIITAKGDLIVGQGVADPDILSIDSIPTGYVLQVDPTAPLGVKWGPPSEGEGEVTPVMLLGSLILIPEPPAPFVQAL